MEETAAVTSSDGSAVPASVDVTDPTPGEPAQGETVEAAAAAHDEPEPVSEPIGHSEEPSPSVADAVPQHVEAPAHTGSDLSSTAAPAADAASGIEPPAEEHEQTAETATASDTGCAAVPEAAASVVENTTPTAAAIADQAADATPRADPTVTDATVNALAQTQEAENVAVAESAATSTAEPAGGTCETSEPPAEAPPSTSEPLLVTEANDAKDVVALPEDGGAHVEAEVHHDEPPKDVEVSVIPPTSEDRRPSELPLPYIVASAPNDLPTPSRRSDALDEFSSHHRQDDEPRQEQSSSLEDKWRTSMHPILSDESSKDIILRFHQQRSFLKRAVEQCADERVFLPPSLAEALRCILVDDAPATAASGAEGNASSPSRIASGGSTTALQQSVSATSYARVKQDLSDLLRERTANRTSASFVGSESQGMSATVLTTEAHVDLTQHAILHHPHHAASILRQQALKEEERRVVADGGCPPPNLTTADMHAPKQLLDAAFQARRAGNRRREIEILVDYVRRGREGRIILDTATTMRLLRRIGDAHSALQEYVAAEQYYFDWYLIAEKVLDWSECARALTLLGQAAHARGDLRAAEEWLQKAQWRVRNAVAS